MGVKGIYASKGMLKCVVQRLIKILNGNAAGLTTDKFITFITFSSTFNTSGKPHKGM